MVLYKEKLQQIESRLQNLTEICEKVYENAFIRKTTYIKKEFLLDVVGEIKFIQFLLYNNKTDDRQNK